MHKHHQDTDKQTFSLFNSMDCMFPKSGVETNNNKENVTKPKEPAEVGVEQNPIFTAFAFSLNIDPKLLEIITEGDEHVKSLSGRSGSGNNSPAGSGRSSPSPITQKKDIS